MLRKVNLIVCFCCLLFILNVFQNSHAALTSAFGKVNILARARTVLKLIVAVDVYWALTLATFPAFSSPINFGMVHIVKWECTQV